MIGIKRRIRTLEDKVGVKLEPITIIIRRVVTNNPRVAREVIEPSESRGDRIYERTIVLNSREGIN